MKDPNSILIGCDDNSVLFTLIQNIKGLKHYNALTASRMIDVINLTNVSQPRIVILCFKNNQEALNSLLTVLPNFKAPVMCLLRAQEAARFKWPDNKIVFTQQLEHVLKSPFLVPRLRSLLLTIQQKIANKPLRRSVSL